MIVAFRVYMNIFLWNQYNCISTILKTIILRFMIWLFLLRSIALQTISYFFNFFQFHPYWMNFYELRAGPTQSKIVLDPLWVLWGIYNTFYYIPMHSTLNIKFETSLSYELEILTTFSKNTKILVYRLCLL